MIYNATIQWKDNQNIQDDMLIVVGIPQELIMGTFMDDTIFFYCEDEDDWGRLTMNEGGDFQVLSSHIDIVETTRLQNMLTSDLWHYKFNCVNIANKFLLEDADGNDCKILDYEGMADDFEDALSEIDKKVVVMCSIEINDAIEEE